MKLCLLKLVGDQVSLSGVCHFSFIWFTCPKHKKGKLLVIVPLICHSDMLAELPICTKYTIFRATGHIIEQVQKRVPSVYESCRYRKKQLLAL